MSFATERGAQLAAAIRSVQLLTRPISLSLGSETTSCQSPCCESPAIALRSPSALKVPVYGPEAGRLGAPEVTSSVSVKDWPAVPCPASTSGTVVPFGRLEREREVADVRVGEAADADLHLLDDPRVGHVREARVADRREHLAQAGQRLADHGRAARVVHEVPLRPGGDGEGHDGASRRRWLTVKVKCSVVPHGSEGSSVTCSGVVLAASALPAMSG